MNIDINDILNLAKENNVNIIESNENKHYIMLDNELVELNLNTLKKIMEQ